MAHGVMEQLVKAAGLDWQVESAGTNGYHTGEAPHPSSIKVCQENNIDISHQHSELFTSNHLKEFDYIFVMAKDVHQAVSKVSGFATFKDKVHFFLDPLFPGLEADVTDPWYGNENGYIPVYNQIEKVCKMWMQQLAKMKQS
jgi:protein-tyrosine phosphatase